MKTLLLLVGLLFVAEGLPYLTFPEAMRKWLAELAAMDTARLRLIGLLSAVTGFVILFLARQAGFLD